MTPERDSASRLFPVEAIPPAVYAADTTPAIIDLRDFRSATLLLHLGAGGITFSTANKIEFVLTHSDDGTTFTPVTDSDVLKDALAPATVTNGIVRALTAAHAAATIQKLGYIGGKPFAKLQADFSGTHGTGTAIAASVVRSGATIEGIV
ncbi:hypothetical protein [Sphingomonas hengshuiensis]|uniref:F5/8 type C domain-containing protein n=1 Tax=Sphingomonas hengshuiensis TaxID=1609977 RepID=A0A7U4J9X6_9SPHN|nr:hypothetical protein [Sphingomonas hengshuiensis]AJP72933.1 hypothetical protein TS85_15735 [Sphingomonas hengshuiensis]